MQDRWAQHGRTYDRKAQDGRAQDDMMQDAGRQSDENKNKNKNKMLMDKSPWTATDVVRHYMEADRRWTLDKRRMSNGRPDIIVMLWHYNSQHCATMLKCAATMAAL
jgi:hypothetical protein